jgi:hypothetical protein
MPCGVEINFRSFNTFRVSVYNLVYIAERILLTGVGPEWNLPANFFKFACTDNAPLFSAILEVLFI